CVLVSRAQGIIPFDARGSGTRTGCRTPPAWVACAARLSYEEGWVRKPPRALSSGLSYYWGSDLPASGRMEARYSSLMITSVEKAGQGIQRFFYSLSRTRSVRVHRAERLTFQGLRDRRPSG